MTIAPAAPSVTGGPFKGLASYQDSDLDALLFFGREREREVIAANLLASRLTVLYGASGVGKSSVLRAGVAHHLREMATRNLETRGHPEFAVVVFDSWTGNAIEELLATVAEELADAFGRDLAEERASTPTDTLQDWTSRLDCDLLLVLDQAEEYFLYHEHEEGPGTFAGELPDLVTRPGLRVSTLLAIRDDALSQLDRFKGRIPNLFANYLRLDHLDRRAGRAAILGPIEQYNRLAAPVPLVAMEPELVEALLDETAAGRVDLGRRGRGVVRRSGARERVEAPYLQLVLLRLWDEEAAAGSNVLRLSTLERLGGANEIVRTHLERALAELPPEDKDVAADVFGHLVTPSGTKIAHGLHDLAEYAHVRETRLAPIVSRLVDERILRPVAKPADGGEAPFEIFHDVLGDAVLAWRTTYDADRRVARERAEADRRHKRVLRILALAFVGLVVTTGVAAYALDLRAEAKRLADIATERAAFAEKQQRKAEASEERANVSAAKEKAAHDEAVEAKEEEVAAREEAEEQAAIADQKTAEVVEQKQLTEDALEQSEASRAQAIRDRGRADEATADALKQRQQALRSAAGQRRAANEARARELTALAREQLRLDPVETLRLALRAAALRPSTDVEEVLRDGLVDVRLRAIVRGGGPLVAAQYSLDGSVLATGASDPSGTVRIVSTAGFRLLHTVRHGAPVRALAVSNDGRFVAAAGKGGTVHVWETATGRARLPLEHGGTLVLDLEFSPDGRLLASGGDDRSAQVWDVASGLRVHRLPHQNTVKSVRFDPRMRYLVSTPLLAERVARVWSLATGGQVAALEHPNAPTGAQFTPDGERVLTTGTRNLFLWKVGDWARPVLTMVGHHVTLRGASISPDGSRAISWDDAGLGRIWRLDNGTQITMLIRHENSISSGVFAADNRTTLTASNDLTARIWTGEISELQTSLVGHSEPVVSASYAPNGEAILTASADGTARVWDSGAEPLLVPLGVERHEGGATVLDVTVDGRLAASGGADGRIRVWRTTGGLRRTLEQGGSITFVQFSRSGALLCTASSNGTIRIWRVATGETVRTITAPGAVRAAAYTGDGQSIAAAVGASVLIYGADGVRRGVVEHDRDVLAVAFSPDGRRVLSGSADSTARLSRLDGTTVATLRGHVGRVTTVAYSPAGTLVATGAEDGVVRVWPSSGAGEPQRLVWTDEALTSVRFDSRGAQVVAATDQGQIRSWRFRRKGAPVATAYRGHVSLVPDARFSPDGRWVVSSGPTAAGVFLVETGKRVYLLRGHGRLLSTATFTRGSRRIVTAGTDGSVRTYACTVCVRLGELRMLAQRRLAQIRVVPPSRR